MSDVYSFSKLSSFDTCPYCWSLKYIEKKRGKQNAFASYGTFVHSLLEQYAKNELNLEDLASVYEWEYDSSIPETFPKSKFCDMAKIYYEQGLEFFKQFKGYDEYEIVGSEIKFQIEIGNSKFTGIIDLLLKDKDGKYIILDYKSKSGFKSKKEMAEYGRQLYLYSEYVKQEYGEYPKSLRFCLIRKQEIKEISFDEKGLEEAITWMSETIKKIDEAWYYEKKPDLFFCDNLCEFRDECDR